MADHCIFNTSSGSYSPRKTARILALLESAGIRPSVHTPGSVAETVALVREICTTEAEPRIIAVGGDGTFNTVLNGICSPQAILGVIPLGTANVLARELGIRSAADAVDRIARGTARPFTVGRAITSAGQRLFLLMAGIGFDGAVVTDVRPEEKRRFGKLAYVLAALRQYRSWERTPLPVNIDGTVSTCHTVIVCNASRYGGPYRLAPGASIFSPTLEVIGVTSLDRRGFLSVLLDLFLRQKSPERGCWKSTAARLEIGGTKPLQIDGDPAGLSPVVIEALPGFARILS